MLLKKMDVTSNGGGGGGGYRTTTYPYKLNFQYTSIV
jgi:hypothetical protein